LTYVEEPIAPGQPRPRVTELYFDHWKVHGPCFAFERSTGKRLWSATLDWQGVNASNPADVRVLGLAARVAPPNRVPLRPERPDGMSFNVVALDKRNGQIYPLAEDLLSHQLNFCEQRPNLDRKTIDVQIDRNLHRLSFGNEPPPPAKE